MSGSIGVPSGGLTLIFGTQKWGFSCKVQRRPLADILNERLPPKTPLRTPCSWPPWPRFSREKLKIFKVSYKIQNVDPHFKKSGSCKKMDLKSSHWSCLKACFNGYTFCSTTFLVRRTTGAQQSHERPPKNVQMTLKDQSFVNKFKVSFVCNPEDV